MEENLRLSITGRHSRKSAFKAEIESLNSNIKKNESFANSNAHKC